MLWWLADDRRLGTEARGLIADPANDILVSAGSLWEIAVKLRIGKLEADLPEIIRAIARGDFTRIGIDDAHLLALAALPMSHRDPFDHLLIAQSIAEDAQFMSDDRHAPDYPVRVVRCSTASETAANEQG